MAKVTLKMTLTTIQNMHPGQRGAKEPPPVRLDYSAPGRGGAGAMTRAPAP
jgi:hypothetical protein